MDISTFIIGLLTGLAIPLIAKILTNITQSRNTTKEPRIYLYELELARQSIHYAKLLLEKDNEIERLKKGKVMLIELKPPIGKFCRGCAMLSNFNSQKGFTYCCNYLRKALKEDIKPGTLSGFALKHKLCPFMGKEVK
jgi:hypothetical protein